jgi:5,5'-dehydrodivanillate O-demethylase
MVTAEENELLTRIGPGSRMGLLMRRYWHPIAAAADLENRWTYKVRVLGENLVLYKDRNGKMGLIGETCPHRNASLAFGIPTEDGLRCPYHGWKFNAEGVCTELPNETRHALLNQKTLPAYPVQELGGLIFAYLGPLPAPMLPKLDGLVAKGVMRQIGRTTIPCNWLQIMENSVDPVHVEWAHGAMTEFMHEDEGLKTPWTRRHAKIGFDEFDQGIIKRRMLEGQTEDHVDWKIGHPLIFPNALAVGVKGGEWSEYRFQFRVPVDDTNTLHFWYTAQVPPDGATVPDRLVSRAPVWEVPVKDENGEYLLKHIHAQDIVNWVTQGAIADRTKESLGASDKGIVFYRRMLLRELEKVERGEDPIRTIRDPAKDVVIDLPMEPKGNMFSRGFEASFRAHMLAFSPMAEDIIEVFRSAERTKSQNPVPAE